jgi:hypothetical protein
MENFAQPEAEFVDGIGTKVEFYSLLFTVTSANRFYPPPWAKVVWNWFVNIVYGNPETSTKLCAHEFGFWWGLGCTPTHFTIPSITYKVVVYAPAERADILPLFLLYPYVLCVTDQQGSPIPIFLTINFISDAILESVPAHLFKTWATGATGKTHLNPSLCWPLLLKGTVSQYFLLMIFFVNHLPPSLW